MQTHSFVAVDLDWVTLQCPNFALNTNSSWKRFWKLEEAVFNISIFEFGMTSNVDSLHDERSFCLVPIPSSSETLLLVATDWFELFDGDCDSCDSCHFCDRSWLVDSSKQSNSSWWLLAFLTEASIWVFLHALKILPFNFTCTEFIFEGFPLLATTFFEGELCSGDCDSSLNRGWWEGDLFLLVLFTVLSPAL